ncbi:MAG: ATP-dependent nuclease [Thermodesulfobacteriota bacterium]
MKLTKVEIQGFRSIENMTIPFEGNGHKLLVGKNESGKSNILEALRRVSNKEGFVAEDKKEQHDGTTSIIFDFKLEDIEIENCNERFFENFCFFNDARSFQLTNDSTVEDFIEKYASGIISYKIEYGSEPKWDINIRGIILSEGWHITKNEVRQNSPNLARPFVRKESMGQRELAAFTSPLDKMMFQEILISDIRHALNLDSYTFPVVYWKYDENKHNLPPTVNKEEFTNDPDSHRLLKNMFVLSGIEEEKIGAKIMEETDKGANSLKNLYKKVSNRTNKYIQDAWKEYTGITIDVSDRGHEILIGVQDSENAYDFKKRSNGFRRFISFLLSISGTIESEQNPLSQLILIDEPEIGLHPSGARDLRNKLIKLGEKSVVVYATHSVSMIDTENVKNNLIVTKKNENTIVTEALEDGTSPAENIYNAIGYSIYNDLKKVNVFLEGYTDKKALKLFMVGDEWKKVGICYVGKGNIKNICSILDLASRNYYILSDADEAAERKKNSMGNPEFWFNYQDFGSDAITVEDFYKHDFFSKIIKEECEQNNISVDGFDLGVTNRIQDFRDFLQRKGCAEIRELVSSIKNKCVREVKKRDVEEEKIMKVLNALNKKIQGDNA